MEYDAKNERQVIQGMDDAKLEFLVTRGDLTPERANEIKAERVGEQLRAKQAAEAEAERAAAVAKIPDEQVQSNLNTIEDIAMQGTGIAPGHKPIIAPAPAAPGAQVPAAPIVPTPAPAPVAVQAPAPAAEPEPTEEEIAAMDENQQKLEREQAALAMQEVEAELAAEDEQKKIDKKNAEDEAKVDADLKEDSSWGPAIRQAVAIMMGAYSQGLTGAKSNPVVDLIEKRLERVAQEKKWTEEQKIAAEKNVLMRAKHETDRQAKTINNAAALQRIQESKANVEFKLAQAEAAMQKINDRKQIRSVLLKKQLTQEDINSLPLEVKDGQDVNRRVVPIGKNKEGRPIFGLARDHQSAQKLKDTILLEYDKAKPILQDLIKLSDSFGDNFIKKTFDWNDKTRAKVNQQMLVGSMRLSLFGPGVMTDKEQELAKEILRDPSKLMSLSSSNKIALTSILDKLTLSKNDALRREGIEVPPSVNELRIQELKARHPAAKIDAIVDKLRRDGNWIYGE